VTAASNTPPPAPNQAPTVLLRSSLASKRGRERTAMLQSWFATRNVDID